MSTRKGTRAWVVRWEWSGPHAAVDQPVAAILRPQLHSERVRRIVEVLHAARQFTPDDMLYAIRRNGHNPYPARFGSAEADPSGDGRWVWTPWTGEIVCGHNPYLVARLATVWPKDTGTGGVEWEDDPRPGPQSQR